MNIILVSDRLPTVEDGNNYGNVLAIRADMTESFEVVSIDIITRLSPAYFAWGSIKGLDLRPFERQVPWWSQ